MDDTGQYHPLPIIPQTATAVEHGRYELESLGREVLIIPQTATAVEHGSGAGANRTIDQTHLATTLINTQKR